MRSSLQRRTPLTRAPMRRKPRCRVTTEEGRAYMLAVKALPCCAWTVSHMMGPRCLSGDPVEAHHAGRRGLSQKSSDFDTIPLCFRHHADWHGARGVFAGMDKTARRLWADRQIAATVAAVALMRSVA